MSQSREPQAAGRLGELRSTEPLVSVIVPAWNCARWIDATLASVYAQSYRHWEIVLVDDGSTDDTRSALVPHMERIRYYRQRNSGTAAARNAGLLKARGELIAFLDDDDVWFPQKLELQVKAIRQAPECGLVFTDGEIFTDAGTRSASVLSRRLDPWIARCMTTEDSIAKGWLFRELLLTNEIASASSVLVPRRCIDEIGGFDERIRITDDHDLWLRLSLRYPAILVRRCLYRWRWRNDSQSGTVEGRQYRWTRASIVVVEKHLPDVPRDILGPVEANLARMYWLCGRSLFDRDEFRESRRLFVGCLRHDRTKILAVTFLLASYLTPPVIRMLRRLKHGAHAVWKVATGGPGGLVSSARGSSPVAADERERSGGVSRL